MRTWLGLGVGLGVGAGVGVGVGLSLGFLTLTKCVPLGHAASVEILLKRILHALVKAQAVCARKLDSGLHG